MGENIVLLLFSLLPIALLLVTVRYVIQARRAAEGVSRQTLLVGNGLVVALILSIALLAGECYYRFVFDNTDSFALCKTTQKWFSRHFQRNPTGFRDSANYLPNIAPGMRRFTFVGDSFTIGHGIKNVEDRFANQVRALRPKFEVHVLAECGWDTGKQLELVTFLPQSGYECDAVVLTYCLNDISDIVPEWQEILDRIYFQSRPGFFATHSYLVNTFSARRRMRSQQDVVDYYSFIERAYAGDVWEEQRERLTAFKQAVEDAGGQLIVVTFPFLHALGSNYPFESVHVQLDALWTSLEVPHLDLMDVFADMSPTAVTLSARDVHPNEAAHALAGRAIAEFLDEQISTTRPAVHQPFIGPQLPP